MTHKRGFTRSIDAFRAVGSTLTNRGRAAHYQVNLDGSRFIGTEKER